MNLAAKSLPDIEQMIINYGKTEQGRAHPIYRELLEERARRHEADTQLSLDRSMEALVRVAIGGGCTTYGALAEASGVPWSKARHRMNGNKGHLERLLDICHARGLPLLTALCVNNEGLKTCELSDESLRGFAEGAKRLGFVVDDKRKFHYQQRDASWAWGRTQVRSA
jgi:hypothetical protein